MAKRRRSRATPPRARSQEDGQVSALPVVPTVPTQGATTGRYLVLFKEGAGPSSVKSLSKAVGLSIASTADFTGGAATPEAVSGADGLLFPDLGVAVVDAPPDQLHAAAAAEESDILAVEPERVVYAIEDTAVSPLVTAHPALPLDYFRGYRDAVNQLCDKILGTAPDLIAEGLAPPVSETELRWGLQV